MDFRCEQLVLPKEIFVGDKAELRLTIYSDSEEALSSEFVFCESPELSFYERKVERGKGFVRCMVNFQAWKPGKINFLVRQRLSPLEFADVPVKPIEVSSILKEISIGGTEPALRPPMPPQIVPGTTWMIYLSVLAAVLACAAAALFFFKLPLIICALRGCRQFVRQKRNARAALKKIRFALRKFKGADKKFAAEIQHAIRAYMSGRYGENFASAATSEFMARFMAVTQGVLSEPLYEKVEDSAEILVRTDAVRYGGQKFAPDEPARIASEAASLIFALERGEDDAVS